MLLMKRSKLVLLSFILFFSLPFANVYAKINVGTVVFDPPYVDFTNQGFEIDLIKLLCKRINQQCNIITMKYDELFSSLNDEKIDVAIDGIDFYVTPNPLNGSYIYSYPYLLSEGQFISTKDEGIKSIDELSKDSYVGLVRERTDISAGIYSSFLSKKYDGKFKIVFYDNLQKLIDALDNEDIDAAFMDSNEADYWILNSQNKFVKVGKEMKVADGIGIMALPQNAPLLEQFNKQLQDLQNDKTYTDLYDTYFGM